MARCFGINWIPKVRSSGPALEACLAQSMPGHPFCEKCGKHARRHAMLHYLLGTDWTRRQHMAEHAIPKAVPTKVGPDTPPTMGQAWTSWLTGTPQQHQVGGIMHDLPPAGQGRDLPAPDMAVAQPQKAKGKPKTRGGPSPVRPMLPGAGGPIPAPVRDSRRARRRAEQWKGTPSAFIYGDDT